MGPWLNKASRGRRRPVLRHHWRQERGGVARQTCREARHALRAARLPKRHRHQTAPATLRRELTLARQGGRTSAKAPRPRAKLRHRPQRTPHKCNPEMARHDRNSLEDSNFGRRASGPPRRILASCAGPGVARRSLRWKGASAPPSADTLAVMGPRHAKASRATRRMRSMWRRAERICRMHKAHHIWSCFATRPHGCLACVADPWRHTKRRPQDSSPCDVASYNAPPANVPPAMLVAGGRRHKRTASCTARGAAHETCAPSRLEITMPGIGWLQFLHWGPLGVGSAALRGAGCLPFGAWLSKDTVTHYMDSVTHVSERGHSSNRLLGPGLARSGTHSTASRSAVLSPGPDSRAPDSRLAQAWSAFSGLWTPKAGTKASRRRLNSCFHAPGTNR